jgi:hypothetical protein
MATSRPVRVRNRLNTYTGYSISCAAVWAAILAAAQRRLDPGTRNALRLWCVAWWSGWTSATIARAGYPPPKKLTPRGEKWLGIVAVVLVALGLGNVIRLLATGKRPGASTGT